MIAASLVLLDSPVPAQQALASAIFANCFLGETLHTCGALGCALCVLGSVILVSFAPEETQLQSVEEIWVRQRPARFGLPGVRPGPDCA